MAMRLALVLAAVLLLVPTAGAEARTRKPCSAQGSTTLLANERARVYRVGEDDYKIYGCLYARNRRRLMAEWFNCECSRADEPHPGVWLTGRYVAVNPWGCSPIDTQAPCTGRLFSMDLRSGRIKYLAANAGGPLPDVALKANGAFAYLAGGELRKFDADGEGVLDPGPGIEGGSLALTGSRLYWMRDGQPRSALLN